METKEEKKWCVYIHRNKTNNKAYIGITSRPPRSRWGVLMEKNIAGITSLDLQMQLKKYGWDNFEHIIWADELTKKRSTRMGN